MSVVKVNKQLAENVLAVVDQGLSYGVGTPLPGKMCVEAAVCYAYGEPHSDEPICVLRIVRDLKITFNDASWWKNDDILRANGLRKIAVFQLGTEGKISPAEFASRYLLFLVTKILPLNPPPGTKRWQKAVLEMAKTFNHVDQVKSFLRYVTNDDLFEDCFVDEVETFIHSVEYFIPHSSKAKIVNKIRPLMIEGACQILKDLKSPGAKFWAKLPPSIRNKKITKATIKADQEKYRELFEELGDRSFC